jgi:hypothetical protein
MHCVVNYTVLDILFKEDAVQYPLSRQPLYSKRKRVTPWVSIFSSGSNEMKTWSNRSRKKRQHRCKIGRLRESDAQARLLPVGGRGGRGMLGRRDFSMAGCEAGCLLGL